MAKKRDLIFLSLPLLFACGASLSIKGQSWQDTMAQADRLETAGKYAQAAETARAALQVAEKGAGPDAPDVVEILGRLGRFYLESDNSAGLDSVEKRLSGVNPKNHQVWMAIGRLFREEERYPEAEEALKKSLILEPSAVDAESELGRIYTAQGQHEKAAEALREALLRRPKDYGLTMQLAQTYLRTRRYDLAKQTFARAKKIDDKAAAAYIKEGYAYLSAGEDEQGRKEFEDLIAIDTASPLGYHHMGAYLERHQRYLEAEGYYRRALGMQEENPVSNDFDLIHTVTNLAELISEHGGRLAEAGALCRKYLGRGKINSCERGLLLETLAGISVSEDKFTEADNFIKQEEAAENPALDCTRSMRGRMLTSMASFDTDHGLKSKAEALAERASNLYRGRPMSDGLLDLAGLYLRLGRESQSEEIFLRIIATHSSMPLSPELALAEDSLARLYETQDRRAEAESLYLRAIASWKTRSTWYKAADALDGLAAVYEKDGKRKEADDARKQAQAFAGMPR